MIRLRRAALLALALTAGACVGKGDHDTEKATGPIDQDCRGIVSLEMTVGEDAGATAEYQFADVLDIVVSSSGTIWVLDAARSGNPLLRQYDAGGNYIRQVGGQGSGPGEYRSPYALALLRDGRVAVRDGALPGRITLFTTAGTLDAVWRLDPPRYWITRGAYPLQVDTAGNVWLPFWVPPRPRPDRRVFFVRMRPNGTVIDTFPLPPLPQPNSEPLQITRRLPNGGLSIRGISVPYQQPYGLWTWSPSGAFAVARADEYRVEILPTRNIDPPNGMMADPLPQATVVARTLPRVPVPRAERVAARRQVAAEIASVGGGLAVPAMPRYKPPIRSIRYSDDGRLLVTVSMPSRKEGGRWAESNALDVFDSAGQSVCRLVLPDSFHLFRMHGDLVWGVFRGEDDIESIRRYRILWDR